MGKPKKKDLPDLGNLAQPGAEIAVHVTPRAARNGIVVGAAGLRLQVTAPPEDGKANEAVRRLLALALGVAPSRLELKRGATSREKLFVIRG